MNKKLVCVISGRVQGVFFRDFTCRTAKKFNIVGTVENLSDGGVKVAAEGEEENLNKFLAKLKKGPLLSHVDDISVELMEETDTLNVYKGFKILYHGFMDHF